jgi:hypothetical protein
VSGYRSRRMSLVRYRAYQYRFGTVPFHRQVVWSSHLPK